MNTLLNSNETPTFYLRLILHTDAIKKTYFKITKVTKNFYQNIYKTYDIKQILYKVLFLNTLPYC